MITGMKAQPFLNGSKRRRVPLVTARLCHLYDKVKTASDFNFHSVFYCQVCISTTYRCRIPTSPDLVTNGRNHRKYI